MKELLQGRRIGFALRPQLGQIAAGLAIGTVLLDLMAWFQWGARSTNGFVVGALWLASATAIVCLLAAITSFAEYVDVLDEERSFGRLDLVAGVAAALIFAVSAALRWSDLRAAGAAPAPFLLAVGGLVLLLVDGVIAANVYAARQWEELEDEVVHERPRRRRTAGR